MFALDAYYRDQSGVDERAIDVDVPEAIDVEFALQHLRALMAGTTIAQPVYDFATHARTKQTRALQPAPVVLVEGLFALYWEELRELIHTRVFVALDHEECLRRRIARDVAERGRAREDVITVYEGKVRPMYDRYVHATRVYADVILDGTDAVERLVEDVSRAIDRPAAGRSPGEGQR